MKSKVKYFLPYLPALALVTVLSGCNGSSNSSSTTKEIDSQQVNVSAPLNTDQQAKLAASLQRLDMGDVNGAINSVVALQSEVGFNTDIQYALGLALATRSGLSLSSLQAAATPKTVLLADGSQGTTSGGMLAALQNASTYHDSPAFQMQLLDGQAALDSMVPPGTSAQSLSTTAQAQVGVVATVQSLRLISQVLQGQSPQSLDASTINSLVNQNYTSDVQKQLESAQGVLQQTVAPTQAALSDNSGTAAGTLANMVVGKGLSDFANISSNGNISVTQLAGFLNASLLAAAAPTPASSTPTYP